MNTSLLDALRSPILLEGGVRTAYRDPAVIYEAGVFHLFFTLVTTEADGSVFLQLAKSCSTDLLRWTSPHALTSARADLNYSSPGNIVQYNGHWVLCLQTYPRPNGEKYANGDARLFTMKSVDLENWSSPGLLRVKGPDVSLADMGRMIDPYLFRDKDNFGKWWCSYKQDGVSLSWSLDLEHWTYFGKTDAGENTCLVVDNDEYVLFHSPENGIGIKRSTNFLEWRDEGTICLGQKNWPWAQGRLTAGFVLDLRQEPRVGTFLLFFHGSGPEDERTMFDTHASIGLAWSQDATLGNWTWPGKR